MKHSRFTNKRHKRNNKKKYSKKRLNRRIRGG